MGQRTTITSKNILLDQSVTKEQSQRKRVTAQDDRFQPQVLRNKSQTDEQLPKEIVRAILHKNRNQRKIRLGVCIVGWRPGVVRHRRLSEA